MLKDDLNIPLLVTIGLVSALLLVVVLIGTHAWYLWEVKSFTEARWTGRTNERVYLHYKAQKDALAAPPKWVDREKGIVKLPIDRAMEVVATNGGRLPK